MAVKAKLTIRLLAEEVVVAESEDATLWQDVLAAVNSGAKRLAPAPSPDDAEGDRKDEGTSPRMAGRGAGHAPPSSHGRSARGVDGFASELGVSVDVLEGACSPTSEAPYLSLDPHCWEAFKRNTPPRGPGSVAPIALAATLLNLWFRHASVSGNPTPKQCQDVLATIDVRDANATRGVKNSDWLKANSGSIAINPASRSKAIRLAAAFCGKTAPSPVETK